MEAIAEIDQLGCSACALFGQLAAVLCAVGGNDAANHTANACKIGQHAVLVCTTQQQRAVSVADVRHQCCGICYVCRNRTLGRVGTRGASHVAVIGRQHANQLSCRRKCLCLVSACNIRDVCALCIGREIYVCGICRDLEIKHACSDCSKTRALAHDHTDLGNDAGCRRDLCQQLAVSRQYTGALGHQCACAVKYTNDGCACSLGHFVERGDLFCARCVKCALHAVTVLHESKSKLSVHRAVAADHAFKFLGTACALDISTRFHKGARIKQKRDLCIAFGLRSFHSEVLHVARIAAKNALFFHKNQFSASLILL